MKNPELRFKNDIDDWEEKELEQIAKFSGGKNVPSCDDGNYINLTMGSVNTNGKLIYSLKTNHNEKILKKNTLIMPTRDVGRGLVIGRTAIIDEDNKYFAGNCLYILEIIKDNPNLINLIMNSNPMRDKFAIEMSGGNQKQITLDGTKKLTLNISNNLSIQSQIATLLSDIDTKIETQEQKVEKLKTFKSAMLDKMFPKEGQKVPEIRFNGFSGDWEEKELGSVLTLQGGYAFSSKNMSQTGIKIVQIGNVYSNFLDWNNIVYLNENFASNCENFFLKENDLVIAMTRPIISSLKSVKIAKIQKDDLPCLLNQRVGRFLLSNKIVNSFLKCFMETKYFYENVLEKCSSGVQPNISSKDIESIKCYLSPTLKEQEKIGKYFKELDNKIELETNKLNKLKDVKNAMLNKLLP